MTKIYRPILPTLKDLKDNKIPVLEKYNNYLKIHDYIKSIAKNIFPGEFEEFNELVQKIKDKYSISIEGFLYSYEPFGKKNGESCILECIFYSIEGVRYLSKAMDILDIDYECKACMVRASCLNNDNYVDCDGKNNLIKSGFSYYLFTEVQRI